MQFCTTGNSRTETSERDIKVMTCGAIHCGLYNAEDIEDRFISKKKLSTAIIFCVIFMSVEVVGGIKAHSLAVRNDAAHLLSDVACFVVSIFSLWSSGWAATPRRSYGYFRIEILVSLASILVICALTRWIVFEATTRFGHQNREIEGSLMFGVACLGSSPRQT
ncbi:Metal tolerance protein A2 [Cardamine amara subsp. amara]|uniref:Metal tolerance protein A2 n=1 Tax=Cardamine amara subsp. amara TaxID=228776 RepID=A0ABD1B2W2_CARAN